MIELDTNTIYREQRLLAAARNGDERAFADLLAPYEQRLRSRCRRLLGAGGEVEDAFQEAMLRAWRGLAGYRGEGTLAAWLQRIVTNTCLSAIEARGRRPQPLAEATDALREEAEAGHEPPASPEASYERREDLELALAVALSLPPGQRAPLIMREALGLSASEVGDRLGTSAASVNSALQRARREVVERAPRRDSELALIARRDLPGAVVDSYARAIEQADAATVTELLRKPAPASVSRRRRRQPSEQAAAAVSG